MSSSRKAKSKALKDELGEQNALMDLIGLDADDSVSFLRRTDQKQRFRAQYCSRSCQKACWKIHKNYCKLKTVKERMEMDARLGFRTGTLL